MKRIIAALFLICCSVFGDDTIPFKTSNGKAKVSTSGIGTVAKPYDFSNVVVLGIGGGGGGSPGGLVGQLQFKSSSSAFGGVPSLTFNSGTNVVTLQGGSSFLLVDPIDLTKKVQINLAPISSGATRQFTIPNSDFVGVIPNVTAPGQFVTAISNAGQVVTGVVADSVLSLSDVTTNNVSITKHGFAPKAPNDATKYLDGTGLYSTPPGAGGSPGGSTTQIQRNNAGAFGGISTLTSDGTVVTQKAGTNYILADPTDTTKNVQFVLSGLTTGISRTATVPNGNSVWVIADAGSANNFLTGISSGGVITKAQPLFSNLGGSIGLNQQNIPVGKTLYVDSVTGNNATALPNRFDKPYLTLTGGAGALSFASAGDEINVGPGTFTEGSAIALPQNVSFVGAGAGVTTIVCTGGVKPGTGDKIAAMTIDARTGSNTIFSFALGADTTDTAFTDVTVSGVELKGNTDGFYFNKSGISRVAAYDCNVITTKEAAFSNIGFGSIDFHNSTFTVDGLLGGGGVTTTIGVNDTSGLIQIFGGSIVTDNLTGTNGINATGNSVFAHNVVMQNTDFGVGNSFDLKQSGGGILVNDGNVRSDSAALITSGTITQYVNTYEGNIGLSDITTNNVSINRHGFAPKLPNDATKFLDGTGLFSVPPGGGGGGAPVIQNVGDADATIAAGTNVVQLTAVYTSSHVLTLPAASGYATSPALVIIDPKRVLSGASPGTTVSVSRAGSDTINGGTANVAVLGVNETGGAATIYSDGSAKWTTASRGGGSRVTGYIDGTVTTAGDVLTLVGSKWVGQTPSGGGASISDTAFAASWNGVTTIGASKNALYDYLHIMSPNDNGKVGLLDVTGIGIPVTDATGLITSNKSAPSGIIVGTTDTQTISGKQITPRVTSTATSNTPTPTAAGMDLYELTAQAATAAFQAITGSPVNGQIIFIRVHDDGTARTLTWDASYDFGVIPQPSTTVVGSWINLAFRYSSSTTKWVCTSSGSAPGIDDTAFASSWNGVTTTAPSKNAVYDIIHLFDTNDNGKINVLDQVAGITNTDASGVIQAPIVAPTGAIVGTTDTQTLTNKQMTTIELGNASDTTLARSSAGVMSIEGVVVPSISSTNTLTNKRHTPRVTTIASSATPTINTDNADAVTITALATAITSMTTNLTGTPNDFDKLLIRIKDNGTARAITWGASFVSSGATLPTTTVLSKVTTIGLIWDAVKSKWVCIAVDQEP